MSGADSLDHVGIAGRDLDAMAAAFERLGFQLTPLARHSGKRTRTARWCHSAPATAASCCARATSS